MKFFSYWQNTHTDHTSPLNSILSVPHCSIQWKEVSQKPTSPNQRINARADTQTQLMWNEGTRHTGVTHITGVYDKKRCKKPGTATHTRRGPAWLASWAQGRERKSRWCHPDSAGRHSSHSPTGGEGYSGWFPLPHVKPSGMRDVETWERREGERDKETENKDKWQTEMTRTETRDTRPAVVKQTHDRTAVMDDALLQSAALNH